MKKLRCAFLLFFTTPAVLFLSGIRFPLYSNLRAPRQMDGYMSGVVKPIVGENDVILLREEIRVVFPDMNIRTLSPSDTVSLTVLYEFENLRLETISIPVHFIALDIQSLETALNGVPLAVEFQREDEAKAECLKNLVRHRSSFLPNFYGGFLERTAAREEMVSLIPSMGDAFDWPGSPDRNRNGFQLAGFLLTLGPGRNTLIVSYNQRFFVEERGHGYFGSWPEKGVTGFDYLLYPIQTWVPAKDFKFRVSVIIPDFHKKIFVFTKRKIPVYRSNLLLSRDYDRQAHLTLLRGEFESVSADIFTLLVWVDKNAPLYLN